MEVEALWGGRGRGHSLAPPPPCPVLEVCPPHGWSREEEGPELSGRVRTPWLCRGLVPAQLLPDMDVAELRASTVLGPLAGAPPGPSQGWFPRGAVRLGMAGASLPPGPVFLSYCRLAWHGRWTEVWEPPALAWLICAGPIWTPLEEGHCESPVVQGPSPEPHSFSARSWAADPRGRGTGLPLW